MRPDGSPLGAGSSTANTLLTTEYRAEYRVQISDGRECGAALDVAVPNSAPPAAVTDTSPLALAAMRAAVARGATDAALTQCALL